jgi:cytoskeletal protein RodZ
MAQSIEQAKLCPHCANSIALDAVKCPYCKAQLDPTAAPQWAERSAVASETTPFQPERKSGVALKVVAVAAVVLLALGAVFVLSYWPRGERRAGDADNSSELREKEQKIQTLEAELAKLREGNQGSSSQLEELKARLSESQKDLTEAEKKLAEANREIERLTSSRAASAPRPRSSDPAPPVQSAPAPARRVAEPGVYETSRATTVYEEPTASSRVITQIARGTHVTVVRGVGEWLEVRSKHGNPPGFIRADDAMLVGRAN